MAVGICQVMIFFQSIYPSPSKRANALISPNDPPSIPKNMWVKEGKLSGLNFKFANTVAEVTASVAAAVDGTGHVVICAGKEISRKMRPTNAGLKILFPNPPNDIFPMPMAAKAPMARIHKGRFEGRLKANSTPVSMADPSLIVGSFSI